MPDDAGRPGDFIHIGAVVRRQEIDQDVASDLPLRLIAGLVDRLVYLRSSSPALIKILTVDFADRDGRHHFRRAFHKYGFEKVGKDAEGDDVYVFDLSKFQQRIADLTLAVAARRASFYHSKRLWHWLWPVFDLVVFVLKLAGQGNAASIVEESRKLIKNGARPPNPAV